jgi:hypothetical protein
VGAAAGKLIAVDPDAPGARANEAADAVERGRLAAAVCPEQRHDLSPAHFKIDPKQDFLAGVAGLDAARDQ